MLGYRIFQVISLSIYTIKYTSLNTMYCGGEPELTVY